MALEQAAQGCSWPKGMDHDVFLLIGLLGGCLSFGFTGFVMALPGLPQSSLEPPIHLDVRFGRELLRVWFSWCKGS